MPTELKDHELEPWNEWLTDLFPDYFYAPFTDRHVRFWEWVENIRKDIRPEPLVAIWPRGGAKSTNAEASVIRIGARRVRRYVWYISDVQEQADKHVETIGSMLESPRLEGRHESLSKRRLGKYGNPRSWRRNRLWTESGLVVDALGLDVASRGARAEEARPGFMIFDDVDDRHDSMATVQKKIKTITESILPAGSNDCAVLFVQNMIHYESIASMLADGRADFLLDRQISGPFSAIKGLTYEQRDGKFVITGGEATWEGQDLETCQSQINTWGLSAFLREAQHDVDITGGIWDHVEFQHIKWSELPALVRVVVWVDPAVTSTDKSDSMGIQADGIAKNDIIYRLFSWEAITSPEDALKRAIRKAIELGADHVGVETDQGGDTWKSVYKRAIESLKDEYPEDQRWPKFASDKAGAGYGPKSERNSQMLTDYEKGMVVHVEGTHAVLERALRRFPQKPLDLADAGFWSWNDLRKPKGVLFA